MVAAYFSRAPTAGARETSLYGQRECGDRSPRQLAGQRNIWNEETRAPREEEEMEMTRRDGGGGEETSGDRRGRRRSGA